MKHMRHPSLAKVNNILLVLIISINCFIIIYPLWPRLWFWASPHISKNKPETLQALVEQAPNTSVKDPNENTNHIVIPSMLLNEQIHEGIGTTALSKGIWHLPNTSTPNKGGNTVIVAHRFTYTNPRGVFYFLDRLKPGDTFALFWDKQRYVYKVQDSRVVKADETSVEAPTVDNRLTLYTCTPLWNPKDRLVVTATLQSAKTQGVL